MEESEPVFGIPSKLCNRAGIAATWFPVNQIGIFPNRPINSTSTDQPSIYASETAYIYNVRQQVVLFHPTLRKLVNEANGTFISVQETVANDSGNLKADLVKLSLQYRSIIRACLEDLQEEVIRSNSDQRDDLEDLVTIFYAVECIWHLCEILFVDSIPGNAVLPYLLDWIRFHFPKYERKAATLLSSNVVGLESRGDYWETVMGSLMQGRIEVVRALLKQHSSANSTPFQLADECLKSMPIYNFYTGLSVTEFKLKWKHWLVNTQAKIDSKQFYSDKHLNLIMRVTVGEEIAFGEVKAQCETWYELLAAWLFFTEPTIKSFELGEYANKCIAKMGMENRLKHLDKVLLSAMENDLIEVIKEIQHMSENNWLATHLTDLLYHSKKLDKISGNRIRESIIIDYGTLLFGHKSLWQVGLSYLDYCPEDGLNVIELLLSRVPPGNEFKSNKIIKEAKKRDFLHIVHTICKIQGILSLKRGRIGNALNWALKSQDGFFTTYLADRFLLEYCKKGTLNNTDLLDTLGSCMLVSDRLIFLSKYCEFHKLYRDKNFKEAATILISLFTSKLTPQYFWITLLMDSIPLLECDEVIFSSNDTYTLLYYLEEKGNLPEIKEKTDVVRLAAARNLGRALIVESTCR